MLNIQPHLECFVGNNVSRVEDDKLIVLLGDLGVFQMKKAMKEYPSRVLNFGIMEQTMIGFSAGIAKGDYYPIILAFFSFLYSVTLWFSGQKLEGIFVGIWVPSILGFSIAIRQRRRDRKKRLSK